MKTWALSALVAAAVVAVPSAAQAEEVARWTMDEGPGASVMIDSAPAGGENHGLITSVTTGDPGLGDPDSGYAYTFDGERSMVQVPDADAFDPGARPMSVTATVRAVNTPMVDDSYDLVRKGLSTTKGGDWKMEIKRNPTNASVGRLHCSFAGVMADGRRRAVSRIAQVDLIDGRVHTVRCVRTETAVHAVVDGRVFTQAKVSGAIANDQPVVLGAKMADDDVLLGSLDDVVIDVG